MIAAYRDVPADSFAVKVVREPIIERAKTAARNEGFNVRTIFTQTVKDAVDGS